MLEEYLRQFFEHLRYERNVSAHTLRNYSSDLEQFHEHIAPPQANGTRTQIPVEDGPTHQSVEHLAALRAIPKLAVIRPCDAHETREAWRAALERDNAPTAFAFSRQKVAVIDRKKYADAKGLHKGAYILAEAENKTGETVAPQLIIIATGSEVGLAMQAREQLNRSGTPTRVVSMPCWEFFDEQTPKYKESVLPSNVKARLAIEAGVSLGWHKYVGDAGDTLSVDRFGASAPGDDVFKEFGFTVENVVKKAKKLV